MSKDLDLNIFSPTHDPAMALGRIYSAADAPSRRQPGPELGTFLKANAHRIKYLRLQGFLAIDGIEFVIRKMKALADETHSFILDMHRVEGLSESAARLLNQARMSFREDGIAVVFSRIHNRSPITTPLSRPSSRSDIGFLSFEDNDLAVEWCENRLLDTIGSPKASPCSLTDSPLFAGLPDPLLNEVAAVSTGQCYATGDRILASGQAGDGRIFFIESGEVSILVPLSDGAHQRIAKLGPGLVFGEMVLLGQTTRSASVYADSDVSCRIVEAADLEAISSRDPQLKIALLQNLSKDMAAKLLRATQWIAALA
jgi:glutaminase